ncbi:MAG: dynamin family protein [Deltaproteobacteria bacterium]|nr:dynamin family protein [Candidatus Anaeroferrophillacea bacterium]
MNDHAAPPSVSLQETAAATADFLRGLALALPDARRQTDRWLTTIHHLRDPAGHARVPVTVVGTVKSGKSTLVNAIAGQVLLPMAAGITTTFMTAVRPAAELGARIALQPLEQVDFVFQQAAGLLFPDTCGENPPRLTDAKARRTVAAQLQEFRTAAPTALTAQGTFHEPYRLLQNLIQGYDTVAAIYADDTRERSYTTDDFNDFPPCIASEPISAYLARAEVFCPLPDLPELLTLQDCQGLDTPSPTQQAMVVRQLALSPVLLFVISSRMGLRQADYRLLEHIRELGLADRLQFVLNVDLLEHPTRAAMEEMIDRCRRELEEVGCRRPLYSFSALYHLACRRDPAAAVAGNTVDPRKLAAWEAIPELTDRSRSEWDRFLAELQRIGTTDAARIFLDHAADRLQHVLNGARHILDRFADGHTGGNPDLDSSATTAAREAGRIEAAAARLPEALAGILTQIEKKYAAAINSWFGRPDAAGIRARLTTAIDTHALPEDLPGFNRKNPLAPLSTAWRHFHLTTAGTLRELSAAALVTQWQTWEREIHAAVTAECIPLLSLIGTPDGKPELDGRPPLPPLPGWGERLPEFSFTTPAAERFGTVSRLALGFRLLGTRVGHPTRRQSWREMLTDRIRREAREELKTRLLDLQEQVKFAFLRPYFAAWQEQLEALARELTAEQLDRCRRNQDDLAADRDCHDRLSTAAGQLRHDADNLRERIRALAGGRPAA